VPDASGLASFGAPFINTDRTQLLLDEVFLNRNGLPDWPFWPDHTVSIPTYYAVAYLTLAEVYLEQGDNEAHARYRQAAERWIALVN
jgi:hypothetical protein